MLVVVGDLDPREPLLALRHTWHAHKQAHSTLSTAGSPVYLFSTELPGPGHLVKATAPALTTPASQPKTVRPLSSLQCF